MGNIKEQKGITLVALIITIVVISILATVSIQTGTHSVDNTKLKGFYTQLEIIQKRVDEIVSTNESYIDDSGNRIYLKEQGKELSETQKNKLKDILIAEEIEIDVANFKYFTIKDLKDTLDLLHIEYNVFINFDNRLIVAENGIEIEDKTYYVLPNTTYFAETNTNKNIGTIEALEYNVIPYGTDEYKVTIEPTNKIGDLGETGYVRYKEATSKYWEDSNNLEIIVKLDTEYDIQYIDSNNNSIERIIKVEFIENENMLTVTEITEESESEVI